MTSKLTVYIDDSTRRMLKDSGESLSKLVNDAIESYMSQGLVEGLSLPTREAVALPSLSEVVRKRPKARGSSTEIIASQRRGRNARLS